MKEVKRTIFSVPYSKAATIGDQAKASLKYLIQNKNLIVLDQKDKASLKDIKSFASTPMYEMYSRIMLETDLKPFTFLNFEEYKSSVPELFMMDDFAIDGKFIETSVPDEFKNVWINLTPILGKRSTVNNSLNVVDIPRYHGLVVRAYLTMSYNDTDAWLNPNLDSFIIESYSAVLARLLQRSYNLNSEEYLFIQTLFAAYYAQLLSPNTADAGTTKMPALLSRCAFLGSVGDIVSRIEQVQSLIPHDRLMTVADVVTMIQKQGPSRMSKLQMTHVYKMFSAGTMESQSMLLALDYPPYWVHQMLKTASGVKNPMILAIFKLMNIKQRLNKFIMELMRSPTLEINRK